MLAPTFSENLEHTNAVASQLGEGVEEQPQSESTRLGAQLAFVDDYPQETYNLLDRKTPEGSKSIPPIRTPAVLAIKQESQGLIMPAQAAVQNQQEVSVMVQRSLDTSVYGGMTSDKSQLQRVYPQQSSLPTLAPRSSSKPSLNFRYTLSRCTLMTD